MRSAGVLRVDAQEARSGLESLAGHENPELDWHDQYIPEQQKNLTFRLFKLYHIINMNEPSIFWIFRTKSLIAAAQRNNSFLKFT